MQIVTKSIKKGKRYVNTSRENMRFMKRLAHSKVRTALRVAFSHNDWILVETPTVGVRPLTSWDIA